MRKLPIPTTQRFWEKVRIDEETGCWLWTGATDARGYGVMSVEVDYGRATMRAHRVAYIAFRGWPPEGHSVLHRCDTPRCVRPCHLFTGFQAQNIADMREKGRNNEFGHRKRRKRAA